MAIGATLGLLLALEAQAKPFSCGELITQLNSFEADRARYPSLDVFVKSCERDPLGEFDTDLMEMTPGQLKAHWEREECSKYPFLCRTKKLLEDSSEQEIRKELPTSLGKVEERFYLCKAYSDWKQAHGKLTASIDEFRDNVSSTKFRAESAVTSCEDPFVAVMSLGLANSQDDAILSDLNYCVQEHCRVKGGWWKFVFSKTWTGGESPQCKQFYDLSRSYFEERKRSLGAKLSRPSTAACRCGLDPAPPFCVKYAR
ncbi:MAG: hypothetical protein HY553_15595 [Elusimicrobia bacterium]|nr:hypothetical protein [Elusimicrobiota bacterium]